MRNLTLLLLVLLGMILGCSSSGNTSPTAANSALPYKPTAAAPNPAKTYTADLAGQVARITDEGVDETAVTKNVAEVDKAVTYEHLKKNADRYAGKAWSFTGKILEISETGGGTVARVSLDDWGNKAIYVAAPFSTEFVEKNRVHVIGYLAGNYSYTSQANWQITIPAVAARAIISPKNAPKKK